MNSFSYNLKNEVASVLPNGDDESLSQLSAIIKTSGEIIKNSNSQKVLIYTELDKLVELVKNIIKKLYGKEIENNKTKATFSKKDRFQIVLPEDITKNVLIDTEIMQFDEDKYLSFVSGISPYIIAEESKELAFLRGVFIGSFSCNFNLQNNDDSIHKNHTSGYHAEFVFNSETFARDFCVLLADFDIISKMTERKKQFIVYVKGIDMICDLLALVGAKNGMLMLQNESVLRSVKNNINRQNNCISANLTKTVDASIKQVQIIEKIKNTIGLESLDDSLREVAFLRIANPEESLDNLVKLSTTKLTKSGLYHRFKI